jgi:hypothetical protein
VERPSKSPDHKKWRRDTRIVIKHSPQILKRCYLSDGRQHFGK